MGKCQLILLGMFREKKATHGLFVQFSLWTGVDFIADRKLVFIQL